MRPARRQLGFTIIELTLAMSFISILLLAITMTAIQAGKIYNRGIILRSVNSAGRDISDTLRRDFLQTDSRQVSVSGVDNEAVLTMSDGGNEVGGRFCLGYYTYAWNLPRVMDENLTTQGVVVDHNDKPVNFVRFVDPSASFCEPDSLGRYPRKVEATSSPTYLLKTQSNNGEVVLSIHSLSIQPIVRSDDKSDGVYRILFTLGTSKLEEIDTIDQSCKAPIDNQSNIEFCAVNQFNMVARTNGQ